jgi:hypothetical protein
MRVRYFTNDVGPNAYSALRSENVASIEVGKTRARAVAENLACKVLVVPEDRRDLWPNRETGRIPRAALAYVVDGR